MGSPARHRELTQAGASPRLAVGPRLALGAVSGALFAAAGVVALRVHRGVAPLRIDQAVSAKLGSVRLGRLAARLGLTEAWPDGAAPHAVLYAVPVAALAALVALAVISWRRRDWGALVLCLAGPALALVLTDVVFKPLVDRRMHLSLAYPSGHATGAAAVAALALVLCHRWKGWRALAVVSPVALALPAVMGVALVRLNWHYPTDVVGGTAIGAATVLALAAVVGVGRAAAAAAADGDRPPRRA